MEFITLWTPGVKKTPNVYLYYSRVRIQVFFANANRKKNANIRICECEYSNHH